MKEFKAIDIHALQSNEKLNTFSTELQENLAEKTSSKEPIKHPESSDFDYEAIKASALKVVKQFKLATSKLAAP